MQIIKFLCFVKKKTRYKVPSILGVVFLWASLLSVPAASWQELSGVSVFQVQSFVASPL